MNTTATLTKSTLKMFVRNKQSLFFALFMPLVIMLIFGFVGFDRVPKIDVGVVTSSPSQSTSQFIAQLNSISAFSIYTGSESEERDQLNKGKRSIVLVIPDQLMPDPTAKGVPQKQTIKALTNVGEMQQVSTALSILSQMLDKTALQITKAPQFFDIQTEAINSKNQKYIDFLLPGIIAMSIMQMSIFSVAFVFTDYKEKGILKRLLATPMRPRQFVTANVITRLMLALVQTGILIAVGIIAFHSHVLGSPLLILLISFLGGIMFLGLGFTISGIAKTVDAVPAIANLIAFPMLFLSGVFFPTDAMPNWLQHVVNFLPLTHFANAMRDVMANGAGISGIATDLYWILGWAIVLIVLANFTFGFEEKRM